jgi:hypothetical protein
MLYGPPEQAEMYSSVHPDHARGLKHGRCLRYHPQKRLLWRQSKSCNGVLCLTIHFDFFSCALIAVGARPCLEGVLPVRVLQVKSVC